MKRVGIIAICLTLVAFAVIVVRVRQYNFEFHADRHLTPKQFQAGMASDIANHWRARDNNGSQRGGLPSDSVSPQVRQLGEDYQKDIYPKLKAWIALHGALPRSLRQVAGDTPYTKGHRLWSVGVRYRVDGTIVSRDVYSANPANGVHDVWASYAIMYPGHSERAICVDGWDDGTVTYDRWYDFFQSEAPTGIGVRQISAPPGAAGTPRDAVRIGSIP